MGRGDEQQRQVGRAVEGLDHLPDDLADGGGQVGVLRESGREAGAHPSPGRRVSGTMIGSPPPRRTYAWIIP